MSDNTVDPLPFSACTCQMLINYTKNLTYCHT